MLENINIEYLSLLVGVYGWMGILFKWKFFWNHRSAKFMVLMWGERGAKWFSGILSSVLIVFAIKVMM